MEACCAQWLRQALRQCLLMSFSSSAERCLMTHGRRHPWRTRVQMTAICQYLVSQANIVVTRCQFLPDF
jgi:hypothetical protein